MESDASTEQAQWWEAAPANTPRRNSTPARQETSQNADSVFGGSGFAEWQSVSE
jgi:hypothetical protein